MSGNKMCRVAVLISGSGSNLQAILDDARSKPRDYEVVLVVSNNAKAFGLQRATRASIPTEIIANADYSNREQYDAALQTVLDRYQPDLIVLAGFMRILSDTFVNQNLGKMINIHPSLLPKYKGLNTHQRAIDAGEEYHGATVHFVTPTLDDGPVILQARIPVLADDDATTLADHVHEVEHIIYPQAINWFAQGRLKMADGQTLFDGKPISPEQIRYQ